MTVFGYKVTSKTVAVVLGIVLMLSIVVASYSISSLRGELNKAKQNLSAATDTVHSLETKNGEIIQWNQSLIVDKECLQSKLEEEYLNRKEIERKLNSKISSLTSIIAGFSADTIVLVDTIEVIDDTTRVAPFSYTDDWLTVSGKTLFSGMYSETTISDLRVRVPITIGQTEDMKMFVHTTNPNVSIELMQNSIVDGTGILKKKSRWSVGLYGGLGIQYGLISRTIDFGPQFGLGVLYRIF